jgi:hypothetical protein
MKPRKILWVYQLYFQSFWKDWKKILVSSKLGEGSKGRIMGVITKNCKALFLVSAFQ